MEKNEVMQAINSMKDALAQIEKKYTKVEQNMPGDQDGNTGNAQDGVEDYGSLDYDRKKKMLVESLKKGM